MAQIIADGKIDNTYALQQWLNTGGGVLPSGVIRITNSMVIGGNILTDWANPSVSALNLAEYQKAKFYKAIDVIGNDTCIWLDNPDKTKPVIIYTAQGLNTFKKRGTISNLTLKGSGIGILAAYTKKLFLDTVEFTGFENGLVLNNANFTTGKDLHFENCKRAEFDIRSHNSQFYNTTLALCEKGFEVRSNHIGIDGYYANLCGIGLHIASANNVIKRCYLEGKSTKPQLIIGEDKDGLKVNGNSFEALTIAAPGTTAIRFEKNSGSLSISGGEMQSTNFEVFGTPAVDIKGVTGKLPKEIIKI